MAEEKKAEAAEAAPVAPAAGANPKILYALMGVNALVMIGVITVVFLAQKKKEAHVSVEQVAAGAAATDAAAAAAEHEPKGKEGEKGKAGEHGAAGAAAAPAAEVRFFSVGDFTSNLSGPASTHYVKLNINFEMSKEVDEEEMKKRKPQMRDRIISILNAKKPADLQTSEGQNFLKEEIKTVTNSILKSGKIEGVYFSTFIVN